MKRFTRYFDLAEFIEKLIRQKFGWYIDPNEFLRRDHQIRRGLNPDFRYTGQHFVRATTFRKNAPHFIQTFGINNVGVLLLTFPNCIMVQQARRHFNNIWRRFFREIFGSWICVVEFTQKRRIHFHVLVDCRGDIRSGFGFEQYENYLEANKRSSGVGPRLTLRQRRELRDAIPANDLLCRIWRICDEKIPSFGFGRVWDLFPIISNEVGITTYLAKTFLAGLPLQFKVGPNRGARLISYSRDCPRAVPPGWRPPSHWFSDRLKALLLVFGMSDKMELKNELDRRWAFAVMRLCRWLDTNWHDGWPYTGPAALAPKVFFAITTDERIEHFFGHLRDRVADAMATYTPPPGPPPPPPSIPSADVRINFSAI
jgi:hypothetical protein